MVQPLEPELPRGRIDGAWRCGRGELMAGTAQTRSADDYKDTGNLPGC
jgi:hypothetical protein